MIPLREVAVVKKQQWVEYRSEVTAFELRNNLLSGSAAQQGAGGVSGSKRSTAV